MYKVHRFIILSYRNVKVIILNVHLIYRIVSCYDVWPGDK